MIPLDFGVVSIDTPSFKSQKCVHSSPFSPSSCHRGGKEKQQGNLSLSFPSCPSPLLWPLHSPLCLLALPFPAFNCPTLLLDFRLNLFLSILESELILLLFFSPLWVLFYLVPPFPPWIMHSGILYDSRLPSAAWRFTSDTGLGTFPFVG